MKRENKKKERKIDDTVYITWSFYVYSRSGNENNLFFDRIDI